MLCAIPLGALMAPLRYVTERMPDSAENNDLSALALLLILLLAAVEFGLLQRLAREDIAVRALPLMGLLSLKPTALLPLVAGALWLPIALRRRDLPVLVALLLVALTVGGAALLDAVPSGARVPLASVLVLLMYVGAWCRWAGRRAAVGALAVGTTAAALFGWEAAVHARAGMAWAASEHRQLEWMWQSFEHLATLTLPSLFAALVWVTPALGFFRSRACTSVGSPSSAAGDIWP